MGTLHLWRGAPDGAVTWFELEAGSTDRGSPTWLAAHALPGLGAALARLGRDDEARAALERAMEVASRLGMPRIVADALEVRAHMVADDDPDQAVELHHRALTLRVDHGLRTFHVDSLDALAALGDGAHAARLFAASARARGVLGHPRDPVRRQTHEATVAALRAALGDDAFARAWNEGARMTLDQAVAYARRSRGPRRRPSTGWNSLTPTELDVVRLVVDGLTNPEIAGTLFVSRGTVKTHLSHVYAKLGVANRTELATLAAPRLTT
jgi:DNA-binding NarL/FixJ family response regulator